MQRKELFLMSQQILLLEDDDSLNLSVSLKLQ